MKDLTDAKGRTKSNQLDSKHVFILDNVNRIYIYHGKIAPNKDKKLSINFAHKYLHSKNTPHVPISKCMEDYEIDEFKACLDEEGGRNFEIKKSEGSLNSLAKNDLSKSGNEISKFSKDNLKSSKDNLSSATNKAQ